MLVKRSSEKGVVTYSGCNAGLEELLAAGIGVGSALGTTSASSRSKFGEGVSQKVREVCPGYNACGAEVGPTEAFS